MFCETDELGVPEFRRDALRRGPAPAPGVVVAGMFPIPVISTSAVPPPPPSASNLPLVTAYLLAWLLGEAASSPLIADSTSASSECYRGIS